MKMKEEAGSPEVLRIIASARATMIVEGLRRWVLVIGLFLAAAFTTWTDFQPYFAVSAPSKWDMAELTTGSVVATPAESDPLMLGDSHSDKKLPLVMVNGSDWEQWFLSVQKSFHGGQVPENWWHRLSKDDLRDVKRFKEEKTSFEPDVRRLIFAKDEAPLAQVFAGKNTGSELILGLEKRQEPAQYVKVYYSAAPELKGLGSGIYGVPDAFSYPVRHLWYVPLAVMFVLYLILPWPASGKNVCAYKRWQIVLSDFAGCLLYGTFMALPLLIVGGAVQALSEWILFTAFFWGLASLGLCCVWWSYFYAVYRIHVLDEQVVFASPSAVKAVPYDEMSTLEEVRVVPPRWLIIMSWIAALAGRGQAGRAMLLSSSSSEGICIGTRAGDAVYVWITNSMGQESLTNLGLLLSKLNATPAEELPEMREMEAIFPPIIERFSKRKISKLIKLEEQPMSLLERASLSIKQRAAREEEAGKDEIRTAN